MTEEQAKPGSREHFLTRFGSVVEHSPWVAQAVWDNYPREAREEDFMALSDAFGRIIHQASREQRLQLLRAHPDLACGIASDSELTSMSRSEQQGAGLDQCSPGEFEEFQRLNRDYKLKFGFPFIIAVKGLSRHEILEHFRSRMNGSPAEEFATAVENVIRIIGFRIEGILNTHD